jgi:hypothetical protein
MAGGIFRNWQEEKERMLIMSSAEARNGLGASEESGDQRIVKRIAY